MVIAVLFFNLSLWTIPIVIFGVAILFGAGGFYARSEQELMNWQQTFRCMRCGNTFIPHGKIKGSRLQWHYLKRIAILNKEIELG
jgi:hypothetical protein